MHDWMVGNLWGSNVSMGVIVEGGKYDIDGDLCFSYPVNCKNGEWEIVEGLEISEFSREKLNKTQAELLEERKIALGR